MQVTTSNKNTLHHTDSNLWPKQCKKMLLLARGWPALFTKIALFQLPVFQLLKANQAISTSVKPLPVMHFVHVDAICTSLALHRSTTGEWFRCPWVELVSYITQQTIQHVAWHGALSSCTCFSQLVAYTAECWVSYTVIAQ